MISKLKPIDLRMNVFWILALTFSIAMLGGCEQRVRPPPSIAVQPKAQCFMCDNSSQDYLVFFDSNRADISAHGESIIRQVAKDDRADGFAAIYVSGFTDTTGNKQYDRELSSNRALAVKHSLIADGVQAQTIRIFAYGQTNLLVPTPPGVNAPQNRRVEIFAYFPGRPIPTQPYETGPVRVIPVKNGSLIP